MTESYQEARREIINETLHSWALGAAGVAVLIALYLLS